MKNFLRMATAIVFFVTAMVILPNSVSADLPPGRLVNGAATIYGDILVNGEQIQSPMPYVRGAEGNIMVPLRAAVEALGISVEWREDDQRILIGGNTEIWVGQTQFYVGTYFAGHFGPPPEISDGHTFVSLPFFNYALNGFHAEIVDGTISIDTLPYFIYRELDNVVKATFTLVDDEDALAMPVQNIEIGFNDENRNAIFSFLRLPFGADLMADEVSFAQLRMKVAEGDVPSSISVAFVTDTWNIQSLTFSEAMQISHAGAATLATNYQDGWVSLDITDFIKAWLAGEQRNNGLALFPTVSGHNVSFVSGNDGALEIPYITIFGQTGERPTGHSAFPFFRKTPVDGIVNYLETAGGGNCLAFALRDLNPITMAHLDFDFEDLDREYQAGGQEAVLEFIAQLIKSYVADHGDALQISDFRRIDSFDSPIEADEYRIAFRVGTHVPEGMTLNRYNFDFHLWAQIDDGRWSQKFALSYSEIVPGTAYNIDPAIYDWHAARQWSNERWLNFYNSRIIYFAVTKDTAEFTSHRGE